MAHRVALVTGAGSGIGEAIAKKLAEKGYVVIVTDITGEEKRVAEEIRRKGGMAEAYKLDVTLPNEAENVVGKVVRKYGRIDVLVNNAGIYPFKSFLDMTLEDWDKVMNVNLRGVFIMTKTVVPHMIKQRYGRIINISSIAGQRGIAQLVHYCSSKAGVDGFTRALAIELAPYGITVNAVAPGIVKTPGTVRAGVVEDLSKSVPLGRAAKPEDIANLVAFLASDEASWITGQVYVIDGGHITKWP